MREMSRIYELVMSCIYECVMSPVTIIWMSHVSHIWMSHVLHLWMCHVPVTIIWISHVSHIWINHVSHIWMCHVACHIHMNVSCREFAGNWNPKLNPCCAYRVFSHIKCQRVVSRIHEYLSLQTRILRSYTSLSTPMTAMTHVFFPFLRIFRMTCTLRSCTSSCGQSEKSEQSDVRIWFLEMRVPRGGTDVQNPQRARSLAKKLRSYGPFAKKKPYVCMSLLQRANLKTVME